MTTAGAYISDGFSRQKHLEKTQLVPDCGERCSRSTFGGRLWIFWAWNPDASIKVAHPRKPPWLVPLIRAFTGPLADPVQCDNAAGEGLHEVDCLAIRVEYRGDVMPSCGTPCGLSCPPRGDRPSREGGSVAGDRNTPNIRILGSAAGDRNSTPGRLPPLTELCAFLAHFFVFSKFSYFTIFGD